MNKSFKEKLMYETKDGLTFKTEIEAELHSIRLDRGSVRENEELKIEWVIENRKDIMILLRDLQLLGFVVIT